MKPLCSWCKKPIDTDNHYIVIRIVRSGFAFIPFNKTQKWEFHTMAEMKAWSGHRPKGED